MSEDQATISAWFTGPKAENAPWFTNWLARIAEDYGAWRRNYFPEDGVVVDSALRRRHEPFIDAFEDRLLELLARLKADVPFHSPRYAAHMLAEQTLPGIAGYFAAMLYNPNNVTPDVAPVTVRLEIEAGRMLCKMIGYGDDAWAHLCSGGTSANIEALWVARTVRYLPLVIRDVRRALGLPASGVSRVDDPLSMSPTAALESYATLWRDIEATTDPIAMAEQARKVFADSPHNVVECGLTSVCAKLGSSPVLIVPETHHYCFEKALDVLGLGRRSLVSVRVDEDFRMRPDELARALDALDREGRHALAVIAVVGTTEEGSVDPVDRIVDLRAERERGRLPSFWLHGDGAYGGYLRSVTIPTRAGLGEPRSKVKIGGEIREIPLRLPEHEECDALEQLHRCDSVTIDPHKLGYIPYPAGAICFRSNLVKPLVRQTAPYLEDATTNPDADRASESIGMYVLEGSKPGASAAAVWLSHSLIPLDSSGHGRLIRENIRNACELHSLLESYPELSKSGDRKTPLRVRAVCLCPPGSNIVCYAFRPLDMGVSLRDINKLNRAIFERYSLMPGHRVSEQPFFVSRTSLFAKQYSLGTVGTFLHRLGVDPTEYKTEGVFLLRSVLMNPWYGYSKERGRYFLSELVEELYTAASELVGT